MNWFKTSQQQNVDNYDWWGNIKDDLEFWQGDDFTPVFQKYGIKPYDVNLNSEIIKVFKYNGNLWVWEGPGYGPQEAYQWIYSVQDPSRYITAADFNKEFWDYADETILYHGTPEENMESIQTNGIQPRNQTRGIANRRTGSAVFLSSNPTEVQSYGRPIAVNVGAMKADGYMPRVSKESPIEEKESYEILAHKLGLDDFFHEVESGISEETVIMYGNIPAKYLSIPTNDQ